MASEYHIFNGDQLLAQLSPEITGTRIVIRECLMDGPVAADTLHDSYKMRARFLTTKYPIGTIEEYHKNVVTEFERIQNIPPNSAIYLWFEDDLFCQVNCWFVLALLQDQVGYQLYLIRLDARSPYAFSVYTSEELKGLFQQQTPKEPNANAVICQRSNIPFQR
ncbi:MAG: DUF1835 domain-containing protein [Flavobacteriales bacterium]|jgi:hypothetical protein|nr:DUF1835 domain-containing protein [Flavobacteriales bacterium]